MEMDLGLRLGSVQKENVLIEFDFFLILPTLTHFIDFNTFYIKRYLSIVKFLFLVGYRLLNKFSWLLYVLLMKNAIRMIQIQYEYDIKDTIWLDIVTSQQLQK